MYTKEEIKAVSQIILQQLGGNRFIAMTGANSFSYGLFAGDNPGLSFRFRGSRKWSALVISLAGDDTYTLKFVKRVPFPKCIEEKTITQIYADNLQEIFTNETGLYTRL